MTVLTIPASDYHADLVGDRPSLSASMADLLLRKSPLHAWTNHPRLNPNYERTVDDKFDLGTVVHAALLDGSAEACTAVLNYSDWRTGAAKEERDAARAAGLIPLLEKDWDRVQAMYEAANKQIGERNVVLNPALLSDGKPEQTLVWEDDGVLCRARLDWLRNDLAAIDDVKTTSASADPAAWTKTLYGIGADVQAAFYLRGLAAVTASRSDVRPGTTDFRWFVIETYPPYAASVITLAPEALALADDKVDAALKLWKDCLERDHWPAYPTGVTRVEAPAWELTRWMEREAAAT